MEKSNTKGSVAEKRVIFLGDVGVGKTQTIESILRQKKKSPQKVRNNFDKNRMVFFYSYLFKAYEIHIWDFEKEAIDDSLYRLFLTDNVCYVVTASNIDDKFSVNEQARRWLKIIKHYAPNSKVILALNRRNNSHIWDINVKNLKDEFSSLLVDCVEYSVNPKWKKEDVDKLVTCIEKNIDSPLGNVSNLPCLESQFETVCDILKARKKEIQKNVILYHSIINHDLVQMLKSKSLNDLSQTLEVMCKYDLSTVYWKGMNNEGREVNVELGIDERLNKKNYFVILHTLFNVNKPIRPKATSPCLRCEVRYKQLPERVLHRLFLCSLNKIKLDESWKKGFTIIEEMCDSYIVFELRDEEDVLSIDFYRSPKKSSATGSKGVLKPIYPRKLKLDEILKELNKINNGLKLEYSVWICSNDGRNASFPYLALKKALGKNEVFFTSSKYGNYVQYDIMGDLLGGSNSTERDESKKNLAKIKRLSKKLVWEDKIQLLWFFIIQPCGTLIMKLVCWIRGLIRR